MSVRRGPPFLLACALLLTASPVEAADTPLYETRILADFRAQLEAVGDGEQLLGIRTLAPDGDPGLPTGDAVLIDEAWWTPLLPLVEVPAPPVDAETMALVRAKVAPSATKRRGDRLTTYATGDVTQDGETDLVLSFRRPFKRTPINITKPRSAWTDAEGLSSHVGIFRPHDVSQVWVAGTLVRPVVEIAVCDGALAVAYGKYDEPGTVATDAWRWIVFGFLPVGSLPGPGRPICVDIDGDGLTEPAIIERSDR